MFTLKNSLLEIAIHPVGAELQKISAVKNGLEFMWDGNPEIWNGHAPNLFPIVGELKDGKFTYQNKAYHLSRHGFTRRSNAFELAEQSENLLNFKLTYSETTLLNYPFKFEFLVGYSLVENKIKITYTVKNRDDKTIYFSVGGHPAFKCPLYPGESYNDYSLQFEHPETSHTHLLNVSTGLFTSETEAVFKTPDTIPLHAHLFDKDALVFKDLKSKNVALISKNHGEILNFEFEDFPFLGIWAKPKANFVCIEPWQGLADSEDSNYILKDKEGIVALEKNNTYIASYTIEIHEGHLV
ncbi:aldose 1-epimerase family protein [Gelidibacter maritimus]|uniref:Aldose 1-epimerase family protein n=1 Tax=Gelidibacter maritimus TaxID=2761487 RepID=A0A7W2R342_9FLAO|nr:aldose 1-epimerase family protein [Gelidibacter maritimus]MBA6152456.1 aldose 1-epimerase family protein [Gelidibacter maritimus]